MFSVPQKATRLVSISQDADRPRVVVDPGMRRSLLHGNREVSIAVPASRGRDDVGKAGGRAGSSSRTKIEKWGKVVSLRCHRPIREFPNIPFREPDTILGSLNSGGPLAVQ